MVIEYWWKDTAKEQLKYFEKILSHYWFVCYRFHVGCPEVEPGPPW
jgi:hypothetical protein